MVGIHVNMDGVNKILLAGVLLAIMVGVIQIDCHLNGWGRALDNLADRGQKVMGNVQNGSQYIPEAAHAAKDMVVHADGFFGEARLAAKNSVTASQKTVEAIQDADDLIKDADPILWKFDDVADAAKDTISQTGGAMESVETIPPHLNPLLDSSKTTMDNFGVLTYSINQFVIDPKTGNLRDNMSALFVSGANFLDKGAVLEQDAHEFIHPPKYTGKYPFAHGAWVVGKQVVGIAVPTLESGYYLEGIRKGE